MRLHASGVCHSDLNAIDGTAATRCPAVLGHEGAGRGRGGRARAWRCARRARTWCSPGCRRAGAATSACATCRTCARRRGTAMAAGGLLDGTPRLSRDGEPVYHYSFLSTFAERTPSCPRACCVPIPDDVPFEVAALVGCAVATGTGAVWRTAGVRPGERVAVFGCGGVGMSARARRGRGRRRPGRRGRRRPTTKLEAARGARRDARGALGGRRRGDRRARARGVSGGGVDYAIEATGRPEAALRRVPLHARARRRRADRHPARRRRRCTLPALPIPRMERRVLGSIYGSSRPERDFPAMLALYRRGRLPLDRLVSHRLPLDAVEEAFDLLRGGAALRVVLDLRRRRMTRSARRADRRGLVGRGPERQPHQRGLARRGSPTAAAAAGALGSPAARATCRSSPASSPRRRRAADDDRRQQVDDRRRRALGRITWGAAQLGIAQGVLDAVADGLLDAAEAAELVAARRGLGRSGRARRDRGAARQPRGDARARSPTRCAPPSARTPCARSSRAARTRRTRYYGGD